MALLKLTIEIKSYARYRTRERTDEVLEIELHLDQAYQKLITHLLAVQKILILLCRCIICENILKIIL